MEEKLYITFLSKDQIEGKSKSKIFKKYGTKAVITDFAILLGGDISDNFYYDNETQLNERTGSYWTNTNTKYEKGYDDCTLNYVTSKGNIKNKHIKAREIGARPLLSYSSIRDEVSNLKIREDGLLEIEYGEYPQNVASEIISNQLEKMYVNRLLQRTGKEYITDSVYFLDTHQEIEPKEHDEFELNGEKYIRFVANYNSDGKTLSDGRVVIAGKVYWIKVSPVKWLIDEEKDLALSKKIMFSGVQISSSLIWRGNFGETGMKKYLDNCFAKEIIPSVNLNYDDKNNPYHFNFDILTKEDIVIKMLENNIPVFIEIDTSSFLREKINEYAIKDIIKKIDSNYFDLEDEISVSSSKSQDEKPMWLIKLEEKCNKEPDKLHILFFNNIPKLSSDVLNEILDIILYKKVNGEWELPNNVRIIAGGEKSRLFLRQDILLDELLNSFAHVETNKPNVVLDLKTNLFKQSKLVYEEEQMVIHPAIYTYINSKDKGFLINEHIRFMNSNLKTWQLASKILYNTNNPRLLEPILGENITKDFCKFCTKKIITLKDVLYSNYFDFDKSMSKYEKYLTIVELSQATKENVEVVRDFISSNFDLVYLQIFDLMWINGDKDRLEIISKLTEKQYIKRKIKK